jgi:hypothetical protein
LLASGFAKTPPAWLAKRCPASPPFVSFGVIHGSHHFAAHDFVIHDFVYLSPHVTSYSLPATNGQDEQCAEWIVDIVATWGFLLIEGVALWFFRLIFFISCNSPTPALFKNPLPVRE